MKKVIIKVILILLIIIEGIYIILPSNKLNNKIEQVSYENNNISNKSTLAYYLDGKPQENRNTWPTDSPDIEFLKAECYDENNSPIESSEVVSFNYKDHTATITTKKTVYCALYFVHTISLDDIIQRSEANGTLETEAELAARNETIGSKKDDLRRFIGTKDEVTDNFICFGTDSQQTCKDNKDTYMYRIIGIDTEGRLKIIKATKLVRGSSNASAFFWNDSSLLSGSWEYYDLYKRLNGTTSNGNPIFIGNEKYSYMQEEKWTKLIDTPTYYIGNSTSNSNPTLFQNERTNNFTGNKIGLMYLSDYLYADSSSQNGTYSYYNNWLFIQNGLNGVSNTPSESIAPTNDAEWTMTMEGKSGSRYRARIVFSNGAVNGALLDTAYAVRPVFYLESDINIIGGVGTVTDPYIISSAA